MSSILSSQQQDSEKRLQAFERTFDYVIEALNQPDLHEERIHTQDLLREFYSQMYAAMTYSRFGDWNNAILHMIHALVAHNTLNESSSLFCELNYTTNNRLYPTRINLLNL